MEILRNLQFNCSDDNEEEVEESETPINRIIPKESSVDVRVDKYKTNMRQQFQRMHDKGSVRSEDHSQFIQNMKLDIRRSSKQESYKIMNKEADSDDSVEEEDYQRRLSHQFSHILEENEIDPKVKEEKLAEFMQRDLKTDCGHVLFKLQEKKYKKLVQ